MNQLIALCNRSLYFPQMFFCLRSEYFRALLRDHFHEADWCNSSGSQIPTVTLHNISAEVFAILVHYLYCNQTNVSTVHILLPFIFSHLHNEVLCTRCFEFQKMPRCLRKSAIWRLFKLLFYNQSYATSSSELITSHFFVNVLENVSIKHGTSE